MQYDAFCEYVIVRLMRLALINSSCAQLNQSQSPPDEATNELIQMLAAIFGNCCTHGHTVNDIDDCYYYCCYHDDCDNITVAVRVLHACVAVPR